MFKIKICGITSAADGELCVQAGADAIGLNFFPQSKRWVELPTAYEIIERIGNRASKVGVFVNHPPKEVARLHAELQLDYVQLHGDEAIGDFRMMDGIPLIKALRCDSENVTQVREYLDEVTAAGIKLSAILLDAFVPGEFGGTGQAADWEAIGKLTSEFTDTPIILAGGLSPENVGEAIRAVRPAAVDVASGVEANPRQKVAAAVRSFVTAAQTAFARLA